MTQTAPNRLDYAPPPRWHERRWRRVALVAFLVLLAGAIWRWGSLAYHHAAVIYWQHECLNFAQPADQIVYDEGPDAGPLLKLPGYARYSKTPGPMGNRYKRMTMQNPAWTLREPPVILMAACWRHFSDEAPCWPWADGATLFSHEMISKTGIHRLVIIQHTPGIEDGLFVLGVDLDQAIFVPGNLTRLPQPTLRGYQFSGHLVTHVTPQNLRIYAGQIDPADPSHFSVRYEQWGQSDILDGWLKDDGSGVRVAPRKRPAPPRITK